MTFNYEITRLEAEYQLAPHLQHPSLDVLGMRRFCVKYPTAISNNEEAIHGNDE
jgi:hypothetical protein